MASPISRSSSHEEAIEKVSVLKRVCQDSHVSRKVISLTLIAVGIILFISGILLLTLTIASLPSAFSIALGATVLALGTSLVSFGIAMRILRKPPASDQEEDVLASEIIRVKGLVEQKTEEVARLQTELGESQRQIAEVSGELETEKQTVADLQSRLQESEEGLTQAREENIALQTRLQEAETTIQQKEEQIQGLQTELTSEQDKVQQLEARIAELTTDIQEKASRIASLSSDLDRVLANQQGMIERLTTDFDIETTKLSNQLLEKTAQLDAARSTIDQIQQRLNRAEQVSSPTLIRRSGSSLSLNASDGSPTVRNRFSNWWENRKLSRSGSSSGIVTSTSESAPSHDRSSDGSQQDNDVDESEEVNEDS